MSFNEDGNPRIDGGYYIKAKCIQESKIAHAPPHVREIWDWLIKEANYFDSRYNGFEIKRGQLFRTYKEIREGLHWMVGYRKMTYNENHTKKGMKFLRESLMIDTKKELGGVLITILNYDKYQTPENYERTTKDPTERTNAEPMRNHPLPDTKKNIKNIKNEKKKELSQKLTFDDKTVEYILPEILFDQIVKRNPGFKPFVTDKKEETIQAWAIHIDRMIRIDKRNPCGIMNVICWCQSDDFWQNNILSTAKLRKQYDQLEMKMLSPGRMSKMEQRQLKNAQATEKWLNGK